VVGDVKHAALVDDVLAREKPSVVFHAAAYKHVPLMEETNAWQAVRNNAYGTSCSRARRSPQGREVRAGVDGQGGEPTNVMGATKRLAEIVCQSLQGAARSSCWCASATCSAARAA
jgi:FlaA1/EpsC-like NDP-sugar epimerase